MLLAGAWLMGAVEVRMEARRVVVVAVVLPCAAHGHDYRKPGQLSLTEGNVKAIATGRAVGLVDWSPFQTR